MTRANVAGVLRHPLVIALISGALAALLFPWFTRQWQDRQKELALKQSLVDQIATSSTSVVRHGVSLVNGQVRAAGGQPGESPAEIYAVLRNSWLIERASARSAIVTYFPDLQSCWYRYERVIASFLGLVDRDLRKRKGKVEEIEGYVQAEPKDVCKPLSTLPAVVISRYRDLQGLLKWDAFEQNTDTATFRGAYAILAELLLIDKDRLIKSIVSADAETFYHGPFG
jgi:hypothetical protein